MAEHIGAPERDGGSGTAGRNEAHQGDSFCGIYCGACSVLVHGETAKADGFASCCKGIPRSALRCEGCKSGVVYAGCAACPIRTCALGKGVEHCSNCSEYPCTNYTNWAKAVWLLPHIGEARDNLEQIRRNGVGAWLLAQKTRWACASCGAGISWYAATCGQCGQSVRERAHALKGFRRLVCRLLFPVLYRKGLAKAQERQTPHQTGKA